MNPERMVRLERLYRTSAADSASNADDSGQLGGLVDAMSTFCVNAPTLRSELNDIRDRLGTRDERPGDIDRFHEIAHKLCNLLYVTFCGSSGETDN